MHVSGHFLQVTLENMGRQTGSSLGTGCHSESASNGGRVGSDKEFAHRMRSLLSTQKCECEQKGSN